MPIRSKTNLYAGINPRAHMKSFIPDDQEAIRVTMACIAETQK